MTDNVNHPPHYNSGKIEVIEAIEDWKLDYHSGNAVKYIARAGKKDPSKTIEDLQKALWYINRRIHVLLGNAPKPNDTTVAKPKCSHPERKKDLATGIFQCDQCGICWTEDQIETNKGDHANI